MLESLGGIAVLISNSLLYSTPLIFTALGGVISERSGVVNIGLEGMMTMGAFIGATVGYFTRDPWLAFAAAGMAGGLVALLHAVATVSFHADHVVSGIAINFLGPGFALFMSRLFFEGATQTKSIPLEDKMQRPLAFLFHDGFGLFQKNGFFGIIFNQFATVFLAFFFVWFLWFLLYRTQFGLRIRSVGENPEAADTLGIDVYRLKYIGVILSGVFAGFGGAAMSIAVVNQFRQTLISGHGFIALAAVIFGKWKPQGAMLACLFFGFAQALVVFLGRVAPGLEQYSALVAMFPYAATIIVLAGFVGKSVAPAADGRDFVKGSEQ